MTDITAWSITELRAALDTKEFRVEEVVAQYRDRIAQYNPAINSFITQSDDMNEAAERAQQTIADGTQEFLTGIPFAAKDLFCTAGMRTTAGSNILKNYIPPYSATVIERCKEGILFGKTNMDEFAMGSSNEFSAFGPVKNPYDLLRVAGGSSGGSAAAVAAGFVPFALGTDTGGSIRLPASFCNVVGFRPTYGRISRYGAIAMASSLDTVGTFTRTVEDAALLLNVLAGEDGNDATALPLPNAHEDFTRLLHAGVAGMRIGIPKEFRDMPDMKDAGCDPAVRNRYEEGIVHLREQGAVIVELSLPHTPYALATYYVLVTSEVSSNLARYDGMQFGERATHLRNGTLDDVVVATREAGFGPEAKRRIMVGTFCLSAGAVDAYYHLAQKVRTVIIQEFAEAFQLADCLFAPVAPSTAFQLGERLADPVQMYLTDVFALPAPLAGLPAISVPAGLIEGLPIGLQFIAPQRQEATMLACAHHFQQTFPQKSVPLAPLALVA